MFLSNLECRTHWISGSSHLSWIHEWICYRPGEYPTRRLAVPIWKSYEITLQNNLKTPGRDVELDTPKTPAKTPVKTMKFKFNYVHRFTHSITDLYFLVFRRRLFNIVRVSTNMRLTDFSLPRAWCFLPCASSWPNKNVFSKHQRPCCKCEQHRAPPLPHSHERNLIVSIRLSPKSRVSNYFFLPLSVLKNQHSYLQTEGVSGRYCKKGRGSMTRSCMMPH